MGQCYPGQTLGRGMRVLCTVGLWFCFGFINRCESPQDLKTTGCYLARYEPAAGVADKVVRTFSRQNGKYYQKTPN